MSEQNEMIISDTNNSDSNQEIKLIDESNSDSETEDESNNQLIAQNQDSSFLNEFKCLNEEQNKDEDIKWLIELKK